MAAGISLNTSVLPHQLQLSPSRRLW